MSDRTLISGGIGAAPFPADATTTTARTFGVHANTITATLPTAPPPAFALKGWIKYLAAVGILSASVAAPAPPSGITITMNVRRTTGVAPFNVHAEAVGTICTGVADPLRQLWFFWNSGGTGADAAAWTTGTQVGNRDSLHGPVTAFLYTIPGTYTLTCYVLNPATGEIASVTQSITVQDPDVVYAGKTMWYANLAANLPGGVADATHKVMTNMEDLLTTTTGYIGSKGDGWRHLLRGGDTFVMSTEPNEVTCNLRNNNLYIGAYGTGRANITFAGAATTAGKNGVFFFGYRKIEPVQCIVKDFAFDGSACATNQKPAGLVQASWKDGLLYNCTGNDMQLLVITLSLSPVVYNQDGLGDSYHSHSGNAGAAFWDCTNTNTTDATSGNQPYGLGFFYANYLVIQGCHGDNNASNNSARSHTVRIPHSYMAVIANNDLWRSGSFQHCLKVHSETAGDYTSGGKDWTTDICYGLASPSGGVVQYTNIADNDILGAYSSVPVAIGAPSNYPGTDALTNIQKTYFVGNRIKDSSSATQFGIDWSAGSGLVANNLFDLTTGLSSRTVGIGLGTRASMFGGTDNFAMQSANDVWVLNNTMVSKQATSGVQMLAFVFNGSGSGTAAANITVKNNVLWSPNDSAPSIASGSSIATGAAITITGYVASNNSSDAQAKQGTSPFASSTPTAIADFAPAIGSYLRAAGVLLVGKDINGATRPSSPDIGAVEV